MTEWIWFGDDPHPLANTNRLEVALDVETSGLHFQDDVLGVALAWRGGNGMKSTYMKSLVGQASMDDITLRGGTVGVKDLINEIHNRHYLIYHNEAFDNRACYRITNSFPRLITHDTQHMAPLLEWQESRSLNDLYNKYVGKNLPAGYTDMKSKRHKLKNMASGQVSDYGRTDAINTLELFEVLMPRVRERISHTLYAEDREYARLIMQLIRRGLKLNFKWCQMKERSFMDRMVDIEKHMRDLGLRDIGSNPSVATFLFKTLGLSDFYTTYTRVKTTTWPDGIPSVSSDVLENYQEHEVVNLILEWRQLRGAISKWLYEFRSHASIDGYVHALLDPFGTISARMAASNPNVMAMPMEDRGAAFGSMRGIFSERSEFKQAMKYKKYNRLWSVDYSQMETRLAAAMAREGRLLELLNSNKDPYVQMADDLWRDKSRRQEAKRGTLASIYAAGPDKLSKSMGVPIDHAADILKSFRSAFPRISLSTKLAEQQAMRTGYIEVFTGRPRYFGPNEEHYKAFNQKVQTTVAEIIKRAMLDIESWRPGILRLQVHDSVVFFCPHQTHSDIGGRELVRCVAEIMEDAVPEEYSSVVKFPTDYKPWE